MFISIINKYTHRFLQIKHKNKGSEKKKGVELGLYIIKSMLMRSVIKSASLILPEGEILKIKQISHKCFNVFLSMFYIVHATALSNKHDCSEKVD